MLFRILWALMLFFFAFVLSYREHEALLHMKEVVGGTLVFDGLILKMIIGFLSATGLMVLFSLKGERMMSSVWVGLLLSDLVYAVVVSIDTAPIILMAEPQMTDLFQFLSIVTPFVAFTVFWVVLKDSKRWATWQWVVVPLLFFSAQFIPYPSLQKPEDIDLRGAELVLSSGCSHCDDVYRDVSILSMGQNTSPTVVLLATDSAMIDAFFQRNALRNQLSTRWDNNYLHHTGNQFPAFLLHDGAVIAGKQITLGALEEWVKLNP